MSTRVYLDNCCFNRPYDDQAQLAVRLEAEAKLFVQGEIASGRLDLAWSFMMDYEIAFNPFKGRREAIGEWRGFAKEIVLLNATVEARQKSYKALGLKNKDASHLACAVEAGCEYFLTTDAGILRKKSVISEIKIVNPVAYICEPKG